MPAFPSHRTVQFWPLHALLHKQSMKYNSFLFIFWSNNHKLTIWSWSQNYFSEYAIILFKSAHPIPPESHTIPIFLEDPRAADGSLSEILLFLHVETRQFEAGEKLQEWHGSDRRHPFQVNLFGSAPECIGCKVGVMLLDYCSVDQKDREKDSDRPKIYIWHARKPLVEDTKRSISPENPIFR